MPIPGINRAVIQAVNVGRSIAPDVRAVLISDEPEEAPSCASAGNARLPDVPLVIVESPYRALVGPMLSYLHVLDETWPEDKEAPVTFVVIPEYVARSWWERSALQPVGESAAAGAHRAAAHGRGQRPLPARR